MEGGSSGGVEEGYTESRSRHRMVGGERDLELSKEGNWGNDCGGR